MQIRIDGALLTSRIGGLFTPDEMRKRNFHVQGKRFLQEVVIDLGLISTGGHIVVDDPVKTSSGIIAYKSDYLDLKLYEGKNTRNGVVFAYEIRDANKQVKKYVESLLSEIAKKGNLPSILYDIKSELMASAQLFN